MKNRIILNIGNTNIYIAYIKENKIINYDILDKKSIKKYALLECHNVFYISVNNKNEEKALSICKNYFDLIKLKKDKYLFESNYNIDKIGIDRFVSIYYATKNKLYPCLIIDTGTADTFDYINESGIHIGGYITAGLFTMSKALETFTDQLPYVNPELSNIIIGNNTENAIKYGIYLQWIAGIGNFVQIAKTFFNKPKIFFTGGNSIKLKDFFKESIIDEKFIIKGINEYAEIFDKS